MEQIETVMETVRDLAGGFEAFKASQDRAAAETKARLDRMAAEQTERMDVIETAFKRTGHGGDLGAKDTSSPAQREYKAALVHYIRTGQDNGLGDLEVKALSVGSDPGGGYLVTPAMSGRIVKVINESSPLRQLAAVETINTDSLEMLQDIDLAGSGWVSETEARTETTTPTWRKVTIPVHELYAEPRATTKLLDDATVDAEAWLTGKISEKFALDEAAEFVVGNGVGKPRGFATYPSGTSWQQIEQINSGDSNTVTADGLLNLQGALKDPYQAGAVWLMKRSTVTVVRQLKDGQSNYLWKEGLEQGVPPSLLGHPVYFAADMAAVAGAALPIAYGNFASGYQIVDRIGIRVLRDPFTTKGYVKFYTTKRVGGDVVNFEAIKLQKISA